MCGITGVFSQDFSTICDLTKVTRTMASKIKHRGPDDDGLWVDSSKGIALAHRRLSIIDTSAAGHQPMKSSCGRYVMVFNGEIYNHNEIRKELVDNSENAYFNIIDNPWNGHSDSETLLAAISYWGLVNALKKSVGMFAIALWDKKEQVLILARDRMGEKPLYYSLQNSTFLFASELKALTSYPNFNGEVDRPALSCLLKRNMISTPRTIYKGVYKLLPGSVLKLTRSNLASNHTPLPDIYWSLREIALKGQKNIFTGTEFEAQDKFDYLLRQSIQGQMMSDVPLGAFLSGGLDSSIVVAMMQKQSSRPIQSFTIGFDEQGFNEANHARKIANYLGTKHTELYVSEKNAIDIIPRLHQIYDEPFADSSQIPTVLLSELASQHVTVSLSGDGGDELFGGYNRYVWGASIWRKIHWLPKSMRTALAGLLVSIPPAAWDHVINGLNIFLPNRFCYSTPGDKLHKLAEILAVKSPDEIYYGLVQHWKDTKNIVVGLNESGTILPSLNSSFDSSDLEHQMMYMDSISYLPDDILVKVDRAAMSTSLETRVPFLDHRLVEFAWSLPLSMKIREGQGKWLVRQVLDRYVPRKLIERPKAGFTIPLDAWMRGPLKLWVDELLNESSLHEQGYLNPIPIRKMWKEHLSGKRNWSYHLWDVLMFQSWNSSFQKN